jgi:branched-chain amino acid transport system substrate-binding protein
MHGCGRIARWAGALTTLGGLGLLVTSSCNLIVDTNTDQCNTTADCAAKGGAFKDAVCTADHVCATGDCSSNQECIVRLNAPAICRLPNHVCVKLTTADCAEVYPEDALGEDQTIVLGFLGPLTGADASSGKPTWQGVKLALNEIEVTAKGLPMRGSTDRRRLAFVACDDANDPIAVARHMAEDIRVPAIVGPSFSGVTLDVATKVTIPDGTLLMSPSATSPAITDLNDNDLVWRTAPSDALQAIPLAQVVSDLETEINLTPPATLRVAMINKGDAYGSGLATAATAKIKFNGKAASANGNDFLPIQYADETNHDFTAENAQILQLKPHVIVGIGTTEVVTGVVAGVEAGWTGTPGPYWVLSDGAKIDELLAAVTGNDDLRKRIIGTFPGRETPLYNEFKSRFKSIYQEDPGAYAANAYDAAYVLSDALVATSDQTASGALLSQGLGSVVSGQKFQAGPNSLSPAYAALLTPGGSIDYDGVSGPLDFDLATGEAPADIDVWCIVLDSNSKDIYQSSGQYFDSAMGTVTGSRTNCQ